MKEVKIKINGHALQHIVVRPIDIVFFDDEMEWVLVADNLSENKTEDVFYMKDVIAWWKCE